MERRTCPGPWLRRSDGRGVAAPRGACRPHGCPRLAAIRARPSGVRVPCANGGRPRNARGRGDRRAAATCVRVPTGGSGPPGASAVRDHVRPRPTGRRSSFPRGRRNPWDARARRGGGTRHDSSRHRAGGDRGRLPLTRGGTRPTRDRVRRGRRADRARREGRASRRRRSVSRWCPSCASPGTGESGRRSMRTCGLPTRGSRGARSTGSRASCAVAAS